MVEGEQWAVETFGTKNGLGYVQNLQFMSPMRYDDDGIFDGAPGT